MKELETRPVRRVFRYIVVEGDRLANTTFYDELREIGIKWRVLRMATDINIAQARCRAHRVAANMPSDMPNAKWYKGRVTNVDNM